MLFKGTTIPKLPEGFIDYSYRNDVCAHYEKEWCKYIIEVWINYDNPERRETPEQYMVGIKEIFESEFIEHVEFDEPDIDLAARRIYIETFKLMKKYKEEL
jgi:hypothetical protein